MDTLSGMPIHEASFSSLFDCVSSEKLLDGFRVVCSMTSSCYPRSHGIGVTEYDGREDFSAIFRVYIILPLEFMQVFSILWN